MRVDARHTGLLRVILLIGFVLRLAYALDQPTLAEFTNAGGGDSGWYLANGAGFFSGQEHGRIRGTPFYNSTIPIPPLYILFTGFVQQFLPEHETILAMRLIQCLASIATAYLACRIATLIAGEPRAGFLAAALLTFHPALITEPANIATETLYIFFLALGLWLYVEYVAEAAQHQSSHRLSPGSALALAAMAFGLATLTRAVFILFPLVIALHLMWLGRRRLISNWRRRSLLLLVVYAAIVSTWTVYNLVLWDRFVIVSDQLMPALWRAAESDDGSPRDNDALLLEGVEDTTSDDCEIDCKFQHATETYVRKIRAIVDADPAGFIARRINELLYAILQPHGTTSFGEVSIVEAGRKWATEDRALGSFMQVLRIEGFPIKLSFWIFHYIGIVFGTLGMIWSRERWHVAMPVAGFAAYTIIVHCILLALPRYLFPIEIVWLIFASVAIVELYKRRRRREARNNDRS